MADLPVTVLDFGSETCKAGFANPEEDPLVVLPTKVRLKGTYGGEEYSNIISQGNVQDWDQLECITHHLLYDQLGWEYGNEGCVLTSEPLFTPKRSRERLTQMFFESFNVHGLYVAEAPVLSLHAVGRVSGTVLDLGYQKCDIAPVLEGLTLSACTRRLPMGGETLTRILLNSMLARGCDETLTFENVDAIKKECVSVAPSLHDLEIWVKKKSDSEHRLPDGRAITVHAADAVKCGEALFEPVSVGLDFGGLAVEAYTAATSCPLESRKNLLESVIVCGGGACIPGLGARMLADFTQLAPVSAKPVILEPPEYMPKRTLELSSWIGGAVLAKVVFPQNQFVTKYEYDESGPSIVHRKGG